MHKLDYHNSYSSISCHIKHAKYANFNFKRLFKVKCTISPEFDFDPYTDLRILQINSCFVYVACLDWTRAVSENFTFYLRCHQ